jgi:TPR repeat protein
MSHWLRVLLIATSISGAAPAVAAPPPGGRPADPAPGQTRASMRKACDKGDAESCLSLAISAAEGDRGPADPKYALQIFEGALCAKLEAAAPPEPAKTSAPTAPLATRRAPTPANLARAAGCHEAARLHHDGASVVAADLPKAAGLYTRACDGGHLEACTWLARLLSADQGLPADLPRVRAVHGGACDKGLATSCHDLARMLETGDGGLVDVAAARAYHIRACELGEPRGCLIAADMAREGRGGPVDPGQQAALRAKACEVGGRGFCEAPQGGLAPD